jgi:tRNA (guanine9-N1)-methyltransferase
LKFETKMEKYEIKDEIEEKVSLPPPPTTQPKPQPEMSKNQRKRLEKYERYKEKRVLMRQKERQRRKITGKNNKCVIEGADGTKHEIKRKQLKNKKMTDSSNKQRIVIDCSFDAYMNDHDIHSLGKQLSFCYAANRRIESPLQFYLTSCVDKLEELLSRSGLKSWDIHLHSQHFLQLFKNTNESKNNNKICYLTSDSPNELTHLDDDTIYVIGGLVDHNHHKSLCFDLAVENGLEHARLPIGEFMNMKTRHVLTVNQVFEIICRYTQCQDWKNAFFATLPKRKGAQMKEEEEVESSSNVVESEVDIKKTKLTNDIKLEENQ